MFVKFFSHCVSFFPFHLIKRLEIWFSYPCNTLLNAYSPTLYLLFLLTLLRRNGKWKFVFLDFYFSLSRLFCYWNYCSKTKSWWKLNKLTEIIGHSGGPGSKPGRFWRPRKELANEGVLEWSKDPFIPSIATSPVSDATVSLLFESSPVLCACNDCKSECCRQGN